jgi:hypothetical protein
MRMTLLSCGLALEILLISGCAQTPLLEDLEDVGDGAESDPPEVRRRDAGSGKDAGAARDAASRAGSTRDASLKKDAAEGKDAGATDEEAAGEDPSEVGPIQDAAAPKDASSAPAAGGDAAAAVDALVSLPDEPPADASVLLSPRDAGNAVPSAKADASTSQPNQCVPEQCAPCVLFAFATACCNSSNRCACRIGIGPCTLPSR